MQKIYCRWAPSLGELEGQHQKVWKTETYNFRKNYNDPTLFFGLYDLRDYLALWRHRGKKWVLWAGSDILNLQNNFLLNDGKLRIISKIFSGFPRFLDNWLNKNAEHWTENYTEADALKKIGIKVFGVCPSFLGDVNIFFVTYTHKKNPQIFVSCSGNNTKSYGFDTIERIAHRVPHLIFHLYGSPTWRSKYKNVICHGIVPREQMNVEIQNMQCGLRLNNFDGFSEISAKSILWGQYPISKVEHPFIPTFNNDNDLVHILRQIIQKKEPNYKARNWYIKNLNNYPWNYAKI